MSRRRRKVFERMERETKETRYTRHCFLSRHCNAITVMQWRQSVARRTETRRGGARRRDATRRDLPTLQTTSQFCINGAQEKNSPLHIRTNGSNVKREAGGVMGRTHTRTHTQTDRHAFHGQGRQSKEIFVCYKLRLKGRDGMGGEEPSVVLSLL